MVQVVYGQTKNKPLQVDLSRHLKVWAWTERFTLDRRPTTSFHAPQARWGDLYAGRFIPATFDTSDSQSKD